MIGILNMQCPPTAHAGEGIFLLLSGNGNSVPPESGDTLLSREQNKKRKERNRKNVELIY